MGDLIKGDDGLPAEEVGIWAKEKHDHLRRYLKMSQGARNMFLKGKSKSATFIDLFCGPGRAKVKGSEEWIDGSAVVAWKISQEGGAPFSAIYVADVDGDRRSVTVSRLKSLGAPVLELNGDAIDAAAEFTRTVDRHGLHVAFLDPYSLGALDFKIIKALAALKRIDMLIHLSKMDLQRNLGANLHADESAFDSFAPGWRDKIDPARRQQEIRRLVIEYWRDSVAGLGVWPSINMKLITGTGNQHLYWLILAAKNKLAHKLWEAVTDTGQGKLF